MSRVLILDDDVDFILQVQKRLPPDTEWMASFDQERIHHLLQKETFDLVLVRKKGENILKQLLGSADGCKGSTFEHPFKRILVLPRFLWRGRLRQALGGDCYDGSCPTHAK